MVLLLWNELRESRSNVTAFLAYGIIDARFGRDNIGRPGMGVSRSVFDDAAPSMDLADSPSRSLSLIMSLAIVPRSHVLNRDTYSSSS